MTNLTKNEIAVLTTICSAANAEYAKSDTGSTWTDAKEIANGSGMKLKSVIGVLGSLTKKGLIYVEQTNEKNDICCISEEGCDVLMALTPETIEAAALTEEASKEEVLDRVRNGEGPLTADDVIGAALLAAPVEAPKLSAPTEEKAEWTLKGSLALGLSKCASMRVVAAHWEGDRKSYLAAMKEEGMNAATAANSWINGRK